MKSTLSLIALGFVGQIALGAPVRPGLPAVEPVVTGIQMFQNRMPGPVGPRPIITTIKIDAISGGCTKATDFEVRVRQDGRVQRLTILRINPDRCEAVAHRVSLQLRTELLADTRQRPLIVETAQELPLSIAH